MDHFGIGTALQAMLQTYESTARRTGRTTSLIESLRDGDRVVVESAAAKRHIVGLLRERGLQVDVIVVDPVKFSELFNHAPSQGRTLFEHTWLVARYKHLLEMGANDIDRWQRETSGYGTAHIETRREAQRLKLLPGGHQTMVPRRPGSDDFSSLPPDRRHPGTVDED